MQGLVFWLIYPILWLVSILPFRIFYLFSDCCYFVIYHLIGYRKKTVTANLKLALPEKSDVEIRQIRKKILFAYVRYVPGNDQKHEYF